MNNRCDDVRQSNKHTENEKPIKKSKKHIKWLKNESLNVHNVNKINFYVW